MKKSFKKIVVLMLLLMSVFSMVANKIVTAKMPWKKEDSGVHLILDAYKYNKILPKHFRKTTDLAAIEENKDLNLSGLDKLNISGSQQFSGDNLPLLLEAIDTKLPITVLDLRQECHGFINEYAVSWADALNNANVGLSRDQVIAKENKDLKAIKLNEPISFYNNTNEEMVVKTVQNEQELTKSKKLGYERITVRDGGIPNDNMVDYFMNFIKNKPTDSWLHFHCKQGIGRTSTFMIMYDMINNYKELSAEDIIKRQLALADFEDKTLKSFYNDERMGFLNKFYEYCKANGDSFNMTWSKWIKNNSKEDKTKKENKDESAKTSTLVFHNLLNSNSPFIKNNIIPKELYVICLDNITPSERTMIASLQGLVNNHCSFQIYTLNSSQPDYKIWLEDLKDNYKIPYEMVNNPFDLIEKYKEYIKGYVLYDNNKDPSINNACSLAGLKESVVIDKTLESKMKDFNIKCTSDLTNTDENWAYENLWGKGLNDSMVIELAPDRIDALRDYAIMTKSLVFYEKNPDKTELRNKIFSSMKSNGVCLGWGPDEFINISVASKNGISTIASDWSYNLSILSGFNETKFSEKKIKEPKKEENVHYVTFLMSDGDNQQWNLGGNYSNNKWFGYKNRKNLSLGWSISPALYYLSPTVFNLYYKSITNEENENNFIVSPSGMGYIYPSMFPLDKLKSYVNLLNGYMGKVKEYYLSVIDDGAFENLNLWDKFTKKANIQGIFYLDYHRHDEYKGKILWSNNKPIVSCRDLLWESLEDEEELVKRINKRINNGEIDVTKEEAYTFVYVHAWSKEVSDVERAINKLKENEKVRIVNPELFMKLIKENIKNKDM